MRANVRRVGARVRTLRGKRAAFCLKTGVIGAGRIGRRAGVCASCENATPIQIFHSRGREREQASERERERERESARATPRLVHLEALSGCQEAVVKIISNPTVSKAEAAAKQFFVPKWTADADDVINDPDVEARPCGVARETL